MKALKNVWSFLDGKKTYIGGAIVFIAGGLKALEIISQEVFEVLVAIGGSITAYGLRYAVSKLFK